MKEKTIKAKDPATVIAVIGIVISTILSVTAIAVSIYAIHQSTLEERYNVDTLSDGIEIDRTFTKDDSNQHETLTVEPCKGTFLYGYKLVEGSDSCEYTFYYKTTTSASYKRQALITGNHNNVWSSASYFFKADGYTDFNVKLTKTAGTSKKSRVLIDLFMK